MKQKTAIVVGGAIILAALIAVVGPNILQETEGEAPINGQPETSSFPRGAGRKLCERCNGTGRLPCPNPNCIWGKVYDPRDRVRDRFEPRFCNTCNGLGKLDCPDCIHGIRHP